MELEMDLGFGSLWDVVSIHFFTATAFATSVLACCADSISFAALISSQNFNNFSFTERSERLANSGRSRPSPLLHKSLQWSGRLYFHWDAIVAGRKATGEYANTKDFLSQVVRNLQQGLEALVGYEAISHQHTRAHTGVPENELSEFLAKKAIELQIHSHEIAMRLHTFFGQPNATLQRISLSFSAKIQKVCSQVTKERSRAAFAESFWLYPNLISLAHEKDQQSLTTLTAADPPPSNRTSPLLPMPSSANGTWTADRKWKNTNPSIESGNDHLLPRMQRWKFLATFCTSLSFEQNCFLILWSLWSLTFCIYFLFCSDSLYIFGLFCHFLCNILWILSAFSLSCIISFRFSHFLCFSPVLSAFSCFLLDCSHCLYLPLKFLQVSEGSWCCRLLVPSPEGTWLTASSAPSCCSW